MGHPFENKARIQLDPTREGASAMYPFIISSVIPRPIAFVSSLSKEVSMSTTSAHAKIDAQLITIRVAGFCVHYIRAICNALLILVTAQHSTLLTLPAYVYACQR